jgi:rare lipoprotein A
MSTASAPTQTSAPSPAVQSGNTTVSTTGNGITLQARSSAMLRKGLTFAGTAPRGDAGDTIEVERSGHQTNWHWTSTVSATVASDGTFQAVWNTNHIGQFAVRAVVSKPGSAQAASVTPALTVTVYRGSIASWYGPGSYGSRTACGQKLQRGTVGVANRTLKCGTKVALLYKGRTMIVPVIDRGPYANHADWDLTQATAKALGFDGVATIGAVSLPKH